MYVCISCLLSAVSGHERRAPVFMAARCKPPYGLLAWAGSEKKRLQVTGKGTQEGDIGSLCMSSDAKRNNSHHMVARLLSRASLTLVKLRSVRVYGLYG